MKKYGLFDELRDLLTGDLGLGAEQAEAAIFPFEGQAKTQVDQFPINSVKGGSKTSPEFKQLGDVFPGESFKMNDQQFQKFKGDLGNYLSKNPKVNLIALRGKLNQDKKYAWQDISKAFTNLIEEGSFKPDSVQDQQLRVVREPPLPGLTQQFKYIWQGSK